MCRLQGNETNRGGTARIPDTHPPCAQRELSYAGGAGHSGIGHHTDKTPLFQETPRWLSKSAIGLVPGHPCPVLDPG